MRMLDWLRRTASALKQQTLTVYYIARDPRLPWPLRLLALAIAAYALSPIDLIPDFIPVLGLLDDLLLIPLGLALVLRWTPDTILADARAHAAHASDRPISRVSALVIGGVWLLVLALFGRWMWSLWRA